MKPWTWLILLVGFAPGVLLAAPGAQPALSVSSATTPEEKGLAIALETDRRDSGFLDSQTEVKMILKNRHGDESIRHFYLKTLEVRDDGDKSMIVFEKPRDVAGTAILTFSHSLEPDDQWLYLPALKRVKRIASKNKSGPFMGSEFAYEDLGSWEVKKYSYRFLRDDVLDGHECFVVENTPAYAYSGYQRQVEWVDKAMHQPRKIVYYDRKNEPLKTLFFRDYRQYLDQYWRSHDMLMENQQTGKSTRLLWEPYRFRSDLSEIDFSRSALKRVR